jgi:hypothetical protein
VIAERERALRQRVVETYDPQKARALGRSMKDHEVWIVPTLVFAAAWRPLSNRHDGTELPMELVPAALRTRWMAQRKQYIARQTDDSFAAARAVATTAARAVGDLQAGGARVVAGTDTFDAFVLPGLSLHQELELLVSGGLTPLEALQAATQKAAGLRGSARTEGQIAPGSRADLVLLDADPVREITNTRKIRTVVAGGRLYTRDDLDRLLDDVRAYSGR